MLQDNAQGHFIVYAEGLFSASVCSDRPQADVEAWMGQRISGTTGGWMFSENETFKTGEPNPCPCETHPDRRHYLFEA